MKITIARLSNADLRLQLRAIMLWFSGFGQIVRKPVTDTSKWVGCSEATLFGYSVSPRNRMPKRRRHLWLQEITFGIVGCFCGVPRLWPMGFANTLGTLPRYWKKLPLLLARRSLVPLFAGCIPSAKTSASIT